MLIGIVTIADYLNNYGQRLQNYAVEQTILSLGHKPETIMMDHNLFIPLRQRAVLRLNILLKRGRYLTGYRTLSFDRFNRRRMHFSKAVYPNGDFTGYDYVVCGSDQLWNLSSKFLAAHKDFYFADFIAPEKRIAFSASLGTDYLSDEQMRFIAEKADAMKAVSVRERSGAALLRPLCRKEIENTIDPVFLLSPRQWSAMSKKPSFLRDGEQYILTYFLGRVSAQAKACLQKLSEETGMRVVTLHGFFREEEDISDLYYGMGPEEFVYLMAHSAVTLTDSFHACAFSCIFQRPFRWFARTDGAEMNCRMENLFSMFDIGQWAVGSSEEPAEHCFDCNYETFNRVIEEQRQHAVQFLRNALGEREKITNV